MRQQSRHLPAFILLAIADGPLHGGAVQSALNDRLPGLKADSGAIYRVLQQLENSGQVAGEWDTSARGPARKIYQLTAAGWRQLEVWRADIEQRMANLRYFIDTYKRVRRRSSRSAPARNQRTR